MEIANSFHWFKIYLYILTAGKMLSHKCHLFRDFFKSSIISLSMSNWLIKGRFLSFFCDRQMHATTSLKTTDFSSVPLMWRACSKTSFNGKQCLLSAFCDMLGNLIKSCALLPYFRLANISANMAKMIVKLPPNCEFLLSSLSLLTSPCYFLNHAIFLPPIIPCIQQKFYSFSSSRICTPLLIGAIFTSTVTSAVVCE